MYTHCEEDSGVCPFPSVLPDIRYPLGGQDTFFAVSELQCLQISVPLCLNFAYPQDVDDYMRKNRQDGE